MSQIRNPASPRLLVLCTVNTGLDAIAEVLRHGGQVQAIVGVDPIAADQEAISGYVDIAHFASKWNIPHLYVTRYDFKCDADRGRLAALTFDLILIAGWQRIIPQWLIEMAPLGALGGHGSPDGIQGGRGRSPQNWAILLGCKRFDLALFRITSGVDDGPVVAKRSFFYNDTDDILISYKKVGLCMGEMIVEVLRNVDLLQSAVPQAEDAFFYPQRKPEDGFIDWGLPQHEIWAWCRALARPYPGLRARQGEHDIVLWDCVPFDDVVRRSPGTIDFVFEDGCFLVSCQDGRVLIREFAAYRWLPVVGTVFSNKSKHETIMCVIKRHQERFPNLPVAKRILNSH